MSDLTPASPWRWRLLAAAVVLLFAGLKLAWLVHDCPLDLAPDEAHYWDWSRHLDWSYYSKGPLVAWLIRASCWLVGPEAPVLAVRLPALFCGCGLLVGLYVLTVQVFQDERLACLVVAVGPTMPGLAALSSLMTIDAPYLCCWTWALVLGHRAVFRGELWAWLLTGLLIALGILAKYTMVLWLPSLALFLLTSPEQRGQLRRPGFWLMTVLAALGAVPILIWNLRHDWITFKHVNTLAGLRDEAPRLHWEGPLVYIGAQFALLLGFWFALWAAAMVVHRPGRAVEEGRRYLWWLSAPMFLVFLAFSPKTGGGEVNWPATAYLSGLVLTAGWLYGLLPTLSLARRRLLTAGAAGSAALGLALGVLLHCSAWTYPLLGGLAERVWPEQPLALRRIDPTCRLRGWECLADEVDRLRAELQAEGHEPVIAASGWSVPGELAFYCEGQPTVYCLGPAAGGRGSQYDLWRPNPVFDPLPFQGRTFIVVGHLPPAAQAAFEQVGEPIQCIHHVQGRAVSDWVLAVCRGFRGFEPAPAASGRKRY